MEILFPVKISFLHCAFYEQLFFVENLMNNRNSFSCKISLCRFAYCFCCPIVGYLTSTREFNMLNPIRLQWITPSNDSRLVSLLHYQVFLLREVTFENRSTWKQTTSQNKNLLVKNRYQAAATGWLFH